MTQHKFYISFFLIVPLPNLIKLHHPYQLLVAVHMWFDLMGFSLLGFKCINGPNNKDKNA